MPSPTNVPASLPERLADAEGELHSSAEEFALEWLRLYHLEKPSWPDGEYPKLKTLTEQFEAFGREVRSTILARLTAAEAECEALRAQIRDQAMTQLASDAGWEMENDKLRGERDAAVADEERAWREKEEAIVAVSRQAVAALARAERAEKAIRDFLSGDYPNPRSHRPGQCEHGTYYWDECNACDCAHFEAALAHPATAEET